MFKIYKDNQVIATTEKIVYVKKHPTENCYTLATEDDATGVSVQSLSEVYALMGKELDGRTQVVVAELDGGSAIDYNQWLASVVFVTEAQKDESSLDDVTIMEHSGLFPVWDEHWTGKRGTIVRDEGNLYKSIHDISAGQNTKPSKTLSMWTRIGNPGEEYPEYSQPIGSHDAYMKGDRVTYNGVRYISFIDNNIWTPDAYPAGWEKVI